MLSSSTDRFDRVQIILHWVIAVMIITMIALGLYMVGLPKESGLAPGQESVRATWFLLHKSLGITAALLIVLRVVWRVFHKAPALPDYIPKWQKRVSSTVHGLLYTLMLAIPLSGYLQSMYSPYDTYYWGIVVPRLAEADKVMRENFTDLHAVLSYLLIIVLLIHIGAAIKHRLHGNDIPKRMSLFK